MARFYRRPRYGQVARTFGERYAMLARYGYMVTATERGYTVTRNGEVIVRFREESQGIKDWRRGREDAVSYKELGIMAAERHFSTHARLPAGRPFGAGREGRGSAHE